MDRYLVAAAGARPPTVRPPAQPYTAGMPTPQRRMKNTFARPSNWNPAPAVQLSIQMDLLFVPASRLQLRLADGESLLGVNSVRSAAMDYPTIYGSAIRSPATRKAPSIAGCLTWCVACPQYGRCGRFAGIVHIDLWLIAGIACRLGRCFSWQDGSRALQSASRIISSVA